MSKIAYLWWLIKTALRGGKLMSYEMWSMDWEYYKWLFDPGWLCRCGHWQDDGLHCSCCGNEPPWGCDCGFCNERGHEDDEEDYYPGPWED